MADNGPSNSFRSAMFVEDNDLKIDMVKLRELVAAHPNDAVAVTYRLLANLELPGSAQSAVAFAQVYSSLFNDDSLAERVAEALAKVGIRSSIPEPASSSKPPIVVLKIPADQLATCSVYPLIRQLGASHAPHDQLRSIAGQCLLSFEVGNDDRSVTTIPEVRDYVRTVYERFPGFPYYLDFDPRAGSFVTYFGCLADLDALVNDGTGLNVAHPSIVHAVAHSIYEVREHARRIGDSSRGAGEALLTTLPPEAAALVIMRMTEDSFEGR